VTQHRFSSGGGLTMTRIMQHLGRFVSVLLLLFLAALEIDAQNPSLPPRFLPYNIYTM